MVQGPEQKERIKELEMTGRLEELEKTGEIVVAGETTIDDEVLAAIVGVAAKEVEGIAAVGTSSLRRTIAERMGGSEKRARGVDVEHGKKEAILDISITVVYGFNIPTVVINLRKRVAQRLIELVALVAKEVNIRVTDIEFPERMPGKLE